MKDYNEFQFGWVIFIFIIPAQVLMTYLYLIDMGDTPLDTTGFVIISLVIAVTYLLFYGLTTSINDNQIKVSFGIGLIRKSIGLERIKSVAEVKNPWYYGWGIRFIPRGMLYNIHGLNGVELRFNDTEKVIRIGTRDSAKMKQEIERRRVRR